MFVEMSKKVLAPILTRFNYKQQPESAICIAFTRRLAQMQMCGMTKPFVWAHVPNEFGGDVKHIFGRLMTAQGRIKGFPDYVFMFNGGCFAIEFKAPKGKHQQEQKDVAMWFRSAGVKVFTCRSADAGFKVLGKYGLLK